MFALLLSAHGYAKKVHIKLRSLIKEPCEVFVSNVLFSFIHLCKKDQHRKPPQLPLARSFFIGKQEETKQFYEQKEKE